MRDAERRGLTDVPGGTPALDNRLELWHVIRDHVERFLSLYFLSDDDLRRDLFYTRWLDVLTDTIPNGVEELVGTPVTRAGSVELLATLVYMTTVDHEIVDANVFDYQLWNDVQPARVYETGVGEPLDVYQRLVDYNFILSVDRTPLMTDFSSLLPDDDRDGRAAFIEFRKDLAALQTRMSGLPEAVWRIEPRAAPGQHELLTDGTCGPCDHGRDARGPNGHGDGDGVRPRRLHAAAQRAG